MCSTHAMFLIYFDYKQIVLSPPQLVKQSNCEVTKSLVRGGSTLLGRLGSTAHTSGRDPLGLPAGQCGLTKQKILILHHKCLNRQSKINGNDVLFEPSSAITCEAHC